jgi:hypothetical protein
MKAPLILAMALPLVLASSTSFAGHGHGGGRSWSNHVNVVIAPRRYVRPYAPVVSTAIGFGIGYSAGLYAGYPYSWWDPYPSRPVVVEHRTVIEHRDYDDDVVTYTNRPSERSMLRDLQGRCYERSYENGREVRVEVDPSACNF